MLDYVAGLEYNESKVIVDGAETNADGGGLCQVTSTLYNATNFTGLDVIERSPHSAQLPYIRPGMDATMWWGRPGTTDDLDMKFRNTTDGYLLLREYVADDGHVYAEIWGRPSGTEVWMRSKPTSSQIYALAVQSNPLFLVYVALLGCSLYALVGGLATTDFAEIKTRFSRRTPGRLVSVFLAFLAVLFYLMWLSEAVPAVLAGEVPQSVIDNGTPTNAVHVLDMAWILPASILTAI